MQRKREKLTLEWGMDPVPDEPLSTERHVRFSGTGLWYTEMG